MTKRQVVLLLLAMLSPLALGAAANDSKTVKPGLLVEAVASNWFSRTADVRVGDLFLSWSCRKEIPKPLGNPYDFFAIELQGPVCRNIRIYGYRGGQRHVWLLGETDWGVTAIPQFTAELADLYREGDTLSKGGKVLEAVQCWKKISSIAGSSEIWLRPWLLEHGAEKLAGAGNWKEVEKTYQEAIDAARLASPAIRGKIFYQFAELFLARNDWRDAKKYYHFALLESLRSPENKLATTLYLNCLGTAANRQGSLKEAEKYFQGGVAILRVLAPNSMAFAAGIANLGSVALYRGDLVRAERFFRQNLSITQKLAPDTLDLAKAYNSLGAILLKRGEPSGADVYFQEALAISEKIEGAEGEGVAVLLYNRAQASKQLDDPLAAERFARRALSIAQKIDPGGLSVAKYSNYLADLDLKLARLAEAEHYARTALQIVSKVAPRSLLMSSTLNSVGDLYRAHSDFRKAESCYQQASEIERLLAPESTLLAESLGSWAETVQIQNKQNWAVAAKLYEEALQVLEAQTAHLGGTDEGRSTFRSHHAGIWRGYTELLLSQNNPARALEIIERSRAQSLMEMLVTGRVSIRNGVDRHLLEEMQSLNRSLAIQSDNRVRMLAQSNTPQGSIGANTAIAKVIARQNKLDAAIKRTSPHYASLAQPQALKFPEMQALLDQDTTLIEYMLGEIRSRVWTVTPDSVKVYELPSRAIVEASARHVYSLLSQNRCAEGDSEWRGAVANLAHMLIGSIEKDLNGKRLAIVSDGALQYIPFGILPLVDSSAPLIARFEIISLPSASVLAILRSERVSRSRPLNSLAVLADPVFDRNDERVKQRKDEKEMPRYRLATFSGARLTRSITDVGQSDHLPRLIASRREARAILAATPGNRKMAALDFSASRPQATSGRLASYQIVHFATHALLDSSHPELSGLVLSLVDPQGKPQDGFVSLEDVYNMNLPVDVVVLSACETALGKQIEGEGLVGLTRGFMYAGATRVVASLWKMDDFASAELMTRFYREMGQKQLTPAAALRAAQVEMSTGWSPFYWAGFQIQGDWRQ